MLICKSGNLLHVRDVLPCKVYICRDGIISSFVGVSAFFGKQAFFVAEKSAYFLYSYINLFVYTQRIREMSVASPLCVVIFRFLFTSGSHAIQLIVYNGLYQLQDFFRRPIDLAEYPAFCQT